MSELNAQIRAIVDGGRVKRFHARPLIMENTVGHHSFQVAAWVWMMTEGKASGALMMAALAHDLPEFITGDVPAPIKRSHPALAAALDSLETEYLETAGLAFDLHQDERRTLTLADALDGWVTCAYERNLGNRHLLRVEETYRNYLAKLAPYSEREAAVITTVMKEVDV